MRGMFSLAMPSGYHVQSTLVVAANDRQNRTEAWPADVLAANRMAAHDVPFFVSQRPGLQKNVVPPAVRD